MNNVPPATMSKAEKRADDGPSSTFFRSIERGGKKACKYNTWIMCCAYVLHACKCAIIRGTHNGDWDTTVYSYLVNDE